MTLTAESALAQLGEDPAQAATMLRLHKIDRPYLGTAADLIDDTVKGWRETLSLEERLALASDLWDSNVHEGRIAAAKLLTQARIRPDDTGAWDLIQTWVPDFDTRAIADLVAVAGQKRLVADPARLDTVEGWVASNHMWTRRAALIMTLPWTKQNHPKPEEDAARVRILGWAASYVAERDAHMQKAIAWWLRDLSKHDAPRVHAFLTEFGEIMLPFAFDEASSRLSA